MFELWHVTAILGIFALGYFFGRWTVKRYYEAKYEELQNEYSTVWPEKNNKKGKEWAARRLSQ